MANGRVRNVTGTADNLDRRGEGLGTGPVGKTAVTGKAAATLGRLLISMINNKKSGK